MIRPQQIKPSAKKGQLLKDRIGKEWNQNA